MKHKDKIIHFTVSFLIAGLVYVIWQSIWLAVYITFCLGLLKEIIDLIRGGNRPKESLADLLVDIGGILAAISIFSFLIS
jgi:hypothetical protein